MKEKYNVEIVCNPDNEIIAMVTVRELTISQVAELQTVLIKLNLKHNITKTERENI